MATKVYNTSNVYLLNGVELEISPLKIKYLRQVLDTFALIKNVKNDDEYIMLLVECLRIAMKQYYPELSKTDADISDNIDLPTLHKILEIGAGIKTNKEFSEEVKEEIKNNEDGSSWDDIDLVKLESEVFMLGIWKNYDELESSLSMPELMQILSSRRELDYEEKKFMAAMQGIDLDKDSGRGQKEWEDLKARVFSKGQTQDSNDVLSLQGQNARKNGFGIGMGLDYEDLRDPSAMI